MLFLNELTLQHIIYGVMRPFAPNLKIKIKERINAQMNLSFVCGTKEKFPLKRVKNYENSNWK